MGYKVYFYTLVPAANYFFRAHFELGLIPERD